MALLHNACGIPSMRNVLRAGSLLSSPCDHGSSNDLGWRMGGASSRIFQPPCDQIHHDRPSYGEGW